MVDDGCSKNSVKGFLPLSFNYNHNETFTEFALLILELNVYLCSFKWHGTHSVFPLSIECQRLSFSHQGVM